ncbi:DUF3862 domain-containing protein [Companilactobacillus muriivasis]|uniref:DUF3862 domain-containing protein n=1 Tax=Companilactobacillus muriivasis TaxID=3081444 RepID=UPI0030C65AB5
MIDENNSKPFYRRNWFWVIIFSIFIIVSATTYVANFSFYKDQADKATTSQSKNLTEKKIDSDPSLVDKYNSIKTGNKKGFSKVELIELLGQPTTTQQLDVNNPITTLIWKGIDNQNVTIQITVEKDKATSKSIQGLDIDRKKMLTSKDLAKLQVGDSYKKVINTLGDPDDYSDTNGVKTLTYESDLSEIDQASDAMIRIEISNNQIINKEQQNLK